MKKIKGHLLVSYLFKSSNAFKQVDEENELKEDIARLLKDKGYKKFVIADDELINEKLIDK